ncbi:histone deacetylation-related protein [Rhodotorula toruloides]|uniref:Histone deacetylation-related protein n=1 Tax=Rhodotorula toruloides TaxID=5286 RepID=A0A511K9R9_RHOTO|nr:histone deacetylation-related protein [Rhodotorula toruloides]
MQSALDLLSAAALLDSPADSSAAATAPAAPRATEVPAAQAAPPILASAQEQPHYASTGGAQELGDIAKAVIGFQGMGTVTAGGQGRQRVPSSSGTTGLFAQRPQPSTTQVALLPPLPSSGTVVVSLSPLSTAPLAAQTPTPSHGHGTRRQAREQRAQEQQQQALKFYTTSTGSAQLAPTAAHVATSLPSLTTLPLPTLPPLPGNSVASTSAAPPAPTRPPTPPYAVPPESGLIRCVCPYTIDDGFTIQCDICNVWQHAACVGIPSPADVPEEYRCERCDPIGARERGVDGRLAEVGMRVRIREMERVQEQIRRAEVLQAQQHKEKAEREAREESQRIMATERARMLESHIGDVDGLPDQHATPKQRPRASKPRRSGPSAGPAPMQVDEASIETAGPKPPVETAALPAPAGTTSDVAAGPSASTALLVRREHTPRPPASAPVEPARSASVEGNEPSPAPAPSAPAKPPVAVGRKRRVAKQPKARAVSSAGDGAQGEDSGTCAGQATEPSHGGLRLSSLRERDRSGRHASMSASAAEDSVASSSEDERPQTATSSRAERLERVDRSERAGENDRYESWRYEFTPVDSNLYPDATVLEHLDEILAAPPASPLDEIDGDAQPVLQGLRERQDATRGAVGGRTGAKVVEALYDLQPAYVSMPSLPPSQPVAVKPLSHAATSLSAPPVQTAYIPSPYSSSLHASSAAAQALCPYPRPTTYGLFASAPISAGSFILPYKGEVVDLGTYRSNPVNQYELIGTPKGAVRALPHPWSVVVDARTWGNESRFARSGCRPNAVLRVVKVEEGGGGNGGRRGGKRSGSPRSRSRSTTPFFSSQHRHSTTTPFKPQWVAQHPEHPVTATFHLGIFALTDIPKRGEIVLPWDWDDGHLAHLLPSLLALPSRSPAPPLLPILISHPEAAARLSRSMALVTDAMLAPSSSSLGGGCACDRKRDCALWWLARAGSASCFSLTAKGGGGRSTEEIANAFLNSFAVGREKENMGFGAEAPGKRKVGGVQMRSVDLGALVGLERGWIVEEPIVKIDAAEVDDLKDVEVKPQLGDAASDDGERAEDSEVDAMDVDEAGAARNSDALLRPDHAQAGISPSSALTSLPSVNDSSPVVQPDGKSRRPPRESRDGGSDTDDSDLTEPLSDLSAMGDDDEDDEDVSEPDESVLSPPLPSKHRVLARSPSPRPKKTAVKNKKQKRQDINDSDSPLSDFDESAAACAERKPKASPGKKKRKTARVYSSSSSSSEGEARFIKETVPRKQEQGSSAPTSAKQDATGSQANDPTLSSVAHVTSIPAKPKIELKVVTKTLVVPAERSPKGEQGSATLQSTKKRRPTSEAPGSLASLKIRKLKGKKSTPRIQDDSEGEYADVVGSAVPSPTTPIDSAPSRRMSEAAEQTNEPVAPQLDVRTEASAADGASAEASSASTAPTPADPPPPPPEPPKPAPAPARLSLAAYRQRQIQARVPPPPPPPLASVSSAPAPPSSAAQTDASRNALAGVSPAQLEALASILAASSSPASLPATLAPATPSLAAFAVDLSSEPPPLRPVDTLPPHALSQSPPPRAQVIATSTPRPTEPTLSTEDSQDGAESEAGTPPLPPAKDVIPAPDPEPLPAAKFSAADILKSIGDYFGSSADSSSSKRAMPVAQTTPLAAALASRPTSQAAGELASGPPLTSAGPASLTPPLRPTPLPATTASTSSLHRLPPPVVPLSGSALGLDAGTAAPVAASALARTSGTSTPAPPLISSPMPGFRLISAQSSSASSQSSSAFIRSAVSPFPKPRLLSASPATGFGRAPPPSASTARPTSVSPAIVGHAPLYAGSGSRPSPPVRPAELDPSVPTAPKAMQAGLTTPLPLGEVAAASTEERAIRTCIQGADLARRAVEAVAGVGGDEVVDEAEVQGEAEAFPDLVSLDL